jgi:hypothetical protein
VYGTLWIDSFKSTALNVFKDRSKFHGTIIGFLSEWVSSDKLPAVSDFHQAGLISTPLLEAVEEDHRMVQA